MEEHDKIPEFFGKQTNDDELEHRKNANRAMDAILSLAAFIVFMYIMGW